MRSLRHCCPVFSHYVLFFFLMIRRPPRSTLFPTRRSSDLRSLASVPSGQPPAQSAARITPTTMSRHAVSAAKLSNRSRPRSEEHTSELQSRRDLVCRLLLEKKKKKTKHTQQQQQPRNQTPK